MTGAVENDFKSGSCAAAAQQTEQAKAAEQGDAQGKEEGN